MVSAHLVCGFSTGSHSDSRLDLVAKKGVRENVPVDGSCVLETLGEAVEAGMGGVGRVLRGSALRAFNSELGDGGGGIAGDLLGAQPPCVGLCGAVFDQVLGHGRQGVTL